LPVTYAANLNLFFGCGAIEEFLESGTDADQSPEQKLERLLNRTKIQACLPSWACGRRRPWPTIAI